MKWTKQPPKIPGYFWYKDDLTDGIIGKVTKEDDSLWFSDNCEVIFEIGSEEETDSSKWSDKPIERPK